MCLVLKWMDLSAMLGDHVLLEQMMVGCLLSDMGNCLQVFQHHPDIRGQMLCAVFVDL